MNAGRQKGRQADKIGEVLPLVDLNTLQILRRGRIIDGERAKFG